MGRRKTTTIAAAACGVVCAVCVALFMNGVRGEAEAARAEALARYGGEQIEVCVATRDLPAGRAVESGDLELKMWIADLLPADAARTIDEVEGRVPSTPIMEGEVVVLKRFEGQGASLDVPEGFAAVSVPVKDVQAVGGSLSAGTAADLYAIGGTSTALLADDVLVLATSSTGSEGAAAELSWVTVAVAPESVQEVIDASQKSELYFSLPSPDGGVGGSDDDGAESGPPSSGEDGAGGSGAAEPPGGETAGGDAGEVSAASDDGEEGSR